MKQAVRLSRSGFTLVEMLVSITLFTLVMAAALGAVQRETRMFSHGNDRLNHVQNFRYSIGSLEQDLEQAGAGVPPGQPQVVYAGESVFAFNANYASNVQGDFAAVFIEPDAPSAAVSALPRSQRAAIPTTSFSYPQVDYQEGAFNSPAETLIFFLQPDQSTRRQDDFVLFRQVNGLQPELLARRLVRSGDRPFFSYRELVPTAGGSERILPVPNADLPLMHTVPVHLTAADTGADGRIDKLRALEVNFGVLNGRGGDDSRISQVSRLIWLRNIRGRPLQMCGDAPLPPHSPTASPETNEAGDPFIRLGWAASPDDGAGEDDVVTYLLWRRADGSSDWGDPFLSVPSGQTTYQYDDTAVGEGEGYDYTVAAQDCTPQLSANTFPVSVTVPTGSTGSGGSPIGSGGGSGDGEDDEDDEDDD